MNSDLLLKLRKTDLHLHLDGSVRPATLLELARQQGSGTTQLEAIFRAPPDGDLKAYLERFDIVLPLLQTRTALQRASREILEDCAANAAMYAEIRFCPLLHTRDGLPAEEVVEAALEGLAEGRQATGTQARLILCVLHGMDAGQADRIADLAIAYHRHGVVAVDLAGDEGRGFDLAPFRRAFGRAKAEGLHVTVHAGEAGPGENVAEAIETLGAERIGHGTRIFGDPKAVELAREHHVGIEVCLKSNVQTGAVAQLTDHPLRRMLAFGLAATLCTDNLTVSRTGLGEEWLLAARDLALTDAELGQILANGFAQMFMDDALEPLGSG